MTETVLQLLRERTQQASTPGHRRDNARLVPLIESGSSRGAYSSGMTVAIETLGLLPMFYAVYGSSAGALNAAWLLWGRSESTMHAWWDETLLGATIDPRRALRRQPVVGPRCLVHTETMPMGFREILDSTVEFHPIATDALTGLATDLYEQIRDKTSVQAALRASTAMPLLAGEPIKTHGRSFVDAGVSEAVPVRTALAQKATHIVALRTRRTDETTSAPPIGQRLVMSRWFARRAPGALMPWLEARGEEGRLLASHPATLQIRPPLGSTPIGHTGAKARPASSSCPHRPTDGLVCTLGLHQRAPARGLNRPSRARIGCASTRSQPPVTRTPTGGPAHSAFRILQVESPRHRVQPLQVPWLPKGLRNRPVRKIAEAKFFASNNLQEVTLVRSSTESVDGALMELDEAFL